MKNGAAKRCKPGEDIFQLKTLSFNYLGMRIGPWVLEDQSFLLKKLPWVFKHSLLQIILF